MTACSSQLYCSATCHCVSRACVLAADTDSSVRRRCVNCSEAMHGNVELTAVYMWTTHTAVSVGGQHTGARYTVTSCTAVQLRESLHTHTHVYVLAVCTSVSIESFRCSVLGTWI